MDVCPLKFKIQWVDGVSAHFTFLWTHWTNWTNWTLWTTKERGGFYQCFSEPGLKLSFVPCLSG
jgi:hypothetical protein